MPCGTEWFAVPARFDLRRCVTSVAVDLDAPAFGDMDSVAEFSSPAYGPSFQ